MKIRLGFVSNSSSSSFVALVDKEEFDKMLNSATENERKAVYSYVQVVNIFGGPKVTWSTFNSGDRSSFEDLSFDLESKLHVSHKEAWHLAEFVSDLDCKVRKFPQDKVFYSDLDW